MIDSELHHEIKKFLKKHLDEYRFNHSLGVAYVSASLAMCYGISVEKAYLAGLLHDSAKGYSDEEKLEKAEKWGVPVDEYEKKSPGLLHSKLGACIASRKFLIEDEEILSAITYHTTGKPDMSLLEKIVFVADFIEPNRKNYNPIEDVRKLAFTDLDKAVFLTSRHTLEWTISQGKSILHPISISCREYYRPKEEKKGES